MSLTKTQAATVNYWAGYRDRIEENPRPTDGPERQAGWDQAQRDRQEHKSVNARLGKLEEGETAGGGGGGYGLPQRATSTTLVTEVTSPKRRWWAPWRSG